MTEQCSACKGDGWTVESEHDWGCGQNGYECAGVPVQVKCPVCDGMGRVEVVGL